MVDVVLSIHGVISYLLQTGNWVTSNNCRKYKNTGSLLIDQIQVYVICLIHRGCLCLGPVQPILAMAPTKITCIVLYCFPPSSPWLCPRLERRLAVSTKCLWRDWSQGVIFRENSRNIVNDIRYFPWKFFTNHESGYFPWSTKITIAGTNPNPEP